MNLPIEFYALTIFAYLIGSLSAAIIVCRLMGLPDPRSEGSNNPGATNVLRFGGKKAAAITLAGDALKGLIPVVIAMQFLNDPAQQAIVAVAAFLGHLYPLFFGFKGGKGVATACGVFVGLSWITGLALFGIWLVMAKVFKISSLSAIIAALLSPVVFWFIEAKPEWVIMSVFISLMLVWRHRSNIRNIVSGKEGKISDES